MKEHILIARAGVACIECKSKKTDRLYIVEYNPLRSIFAVFLFVFGLMTLILGVNGIVQVALKEFESGIILIVIGTVFCMLWLGLMNWNTKRKNQSLSQMRIEYIFDFSSNALLNRHEEKIDSLSNVYVRKQFNLFSNFSSLVLGWTATERSILHTNIFNGGGVGSFISLLEERGIQKK